MTAAAWADPPPPGNAKPLSEILRSIEQRPDFRYFDEIELDDGRYEIKYYASDGTKRRIHVNPVTGQPL